MILSILQARCSSSRLPGKVMKKILGKPMLEHQIRRVLQSKKIDKHLVATSTDPSDDPIEKLCKNIGMDCFRGSLNDVLDRYYKAAHLYKPDHIVRLTGDCPLADVQLIDNVIEYYLIGQFDYVSNGIVPTFPDGLDVEVFSMNLLEILYSKSTLPSHREHVTQYVHQFPELFNVGNYSQNDDLSHLRWTVDEPEDFEFVKQIYEALFPTNPNFKTEDIMRLLKSKEELNEINQHIQRNEGLMKTLEKDKEFLKNYDKPKY